nr:MAG TPA: protein of unknown function DUF4177 [Caudoviricetes sp.]
MTKKHNTKYRCELLNTRCLDSPEKQLNELFEDGWHFHSVFTVWLGGHDTAEYAVLYKQED